MYKDLILVLDPYDLVDTLACFRIPRTWARRANGGTSLEVMEVAAAVVTNTGTSVRGLATEYGVCHVSPRRFCVRLRKNENPKKGI
jgi:hypothetical protein